MITVRIRCDGQSATGEPCRSRYTVDVTHPAAWAGFGAYVDANGRQLQLDGALELPEGWRLQGSFGALTEKPFRVLCAAHEEPLS